MIADLFYIVLFITASGGITWLSIMLLQHVLKMEIPFRLCSVMMLFYLVPFFSPELKLTAENPVWIHSFRAASGVWATGFLLSACFLAVRDIHAYFTVRKYALCQDEPAIHVLQNCAARLKMKRLPEILYGDLKDPACVIFTGHPKVILSERIVRQLTEQEFAVILTHELIHIKRGHLLLQKCFDLIVCVHWFNPAAWLARQEFSISCEMDCDQSVFRNIPGLPPSDYANLMLKMLKLALPNRNDASNAIGTLDFMLARQRLQSILSPASAVKRLCSVILSLVISAAVISGSLSGSKSYFYPSSAGNAGTPQIERSAGHE